MSMRAGHILRHEDESGVSGTGRVAEWIEYSDGAVVVRWISATASTNIYQNMKQAVSIHGHEGKTVFVTDWEEPDPKVELEPEAPDEDDVPDEEADPAEEAAPDEDPEDEPAEEEQS